MILACEKCRRTTPAGVALRDVADNPRTDHSLLCPSCAGSELPFRDASEATIRAVGIARSEAGWL